MFWWFQSTMDVAVFELFEFTGFFSSFQLTKLVFRPKECHIFFYVLGEAARQLKKRD